MSTVSTTNTAPTSKRRPVRLRRHGGVLLFAIVAFGAYWFARPQWVVEMRMWKAVGDAAVWLLWTALVIGPLAKMWTPARQLLPWRRPLGIWFAVAATIHALLVIDGWARWSVARFFGYEFIPELGRLSRTEPGFGLANLLGLAALAVTLLLAATSSDRAMRKLGGRAWKFLHTGAYFVFYVGAIHALYFLFIHFTLSFHRPVPAPDWFRYWFLAMVVFLAGLQALAFVKTVRSDRSA